MSASFDVGRGDLHIDCTRTVLDNGLVVLVHEDRSAPHVSLSVCYRVGSKDERAGQTGSAHLFEHLMFTGSANFPGLFSTTLTKAGATMVNAYTTPDYTRFFATVPPGMLAFALYAEADRMGSFRDHLTQEALAQQQRIVLEEKAQRAGGTLGDLPEIIRAALYPLGHPYHHPVIGSTQDIGGMTLAAARAWHARFYGPDNAAVVIGGPVDPTAAMDLAREHFSHLAPSGSGENAHIWVPHAPVRRRVTLDAPVAHGGMLLLVWPVAEAADPAIFGLELVSRMLAGDETSPLHRALVRPGGCLGVSAGIAAGAVCSEFTLELTLDAGADPDRTIAAARDALSSILSDAAHDAALLRIRARERLRLALSLDDLATAVDVMINGEMLWHDPLRSLTEIAAIDTMPVDAIRALAHQWLRHEPLVVVIRPRAMPSVASTPRPRAALPRVRQDASRSGPPAFGRVEHPSGWRTITVPRDGARDFVLRLDLPRGTESEGASERGIGALVTTMPHHGIGTIDADALRALLDGAGMTLNISITPVDFVVEMHGPAAAAERAAALLTDMVSNPRFDAAVTAERKREQANHLRAVRPDPMAHVESIAPALLYGADAAGARDPGGTAASIAAITPAALLAHHRRLFDPAGATLFVAGADETLRAIHDHLEPLRARWMPAPDPLPLPPPIPLPVRRGERIHFVAAGPEDQAIVVLALLLPMPADVGDEATARALAFVLERRLGARLRDDLHWTYGVSARAIEAPRPDLPPRLEIGGAVNAEQVAGVIAEIAAALAEIAGSAPPTPAEIGDYAAAARAGITGSLVSTGGRVAAVAMALRRERPADIGARLDALDRLDSASIAALARAAVAAGPQEWIVASKAEGIAGHLHGTGIPVVSWKPN